MMADVVHVAEAGENRGRVVLRLSSAVPERLAVLAALRLARAYQAELESIFIEDQHLIDMCGHAEAAEISLCGRDRRSLSPVTLMRQYSYAARQAERRVAALAHQAQITYRARTIRDEPTHALNRACAESGPWNVVVLADAVHGRDRPAVQRLLDDMVGATALLLVGAAVCRIDGPVMIVLESLERLPLMLRVAERIAAEASAEIVVAMASSMDDAATGMDDSVRLYLADRTDVHLISLARARGHTGALHEAVRRQRPGFLIGQAGAALLPANAGWSDVARALECPLFVMR
jgi:hypothetical protein